MNRLTVWGGVFALLILQACDNGTPERMQTDNSVTDKVTFTSSIENNSASRAYDGKWEKNDRIGVFMLNNADGTPIESNVPYITSSGDGNFVGDGDFIRFPEEGTVVDFVACYPYKADLADGLSYSVDVSDQSSQKAIDLMVSNNLTGRDLTNQATGNNLQFTHVLSKLVLNLRSADNGSLQGLKVYVLGTKVRASVGLKDKKQTEPEGEAQDILMYTNDDCTQAEAVLVPQTIGGKLKLRLEINGKSKEVETGIEGGLVAGNKYIYSLTVSNTGGQIVTDPEAEYTRWFETPVITESQLAQYEYITHYTDTKYTGSNSSWGSVRNYSMLYDTDLKIAYWVAYPLCGYYLGDSGRTDAWDFDPSIPNGLQANLGKGFSGYDRGHQIPSGDRTGSRSMNTATFYYTNMTPQIGKGLNQTIWADLEGAVRGWSSGVDTLYVVTGAMPVTQTDKNITYVEDNSGKDVAVPKYYFKALARRISSTGSYQTIAFKMDQKRYSGNDYAQCALSVNELEEITGFTFFPNIDDQYKNSSELW